MKKLLIVFTALCLMLSGDLFAKVGGGGGGRAAAFGGRSISKPVISGIKVGGNSNPVGSVFKFGSKTGGIGLPASKPKLFESFKAANTTPSKRVVASDIQTMFKPQYRQDRRRQFYSDYHAPSYAQPIIVQHSNYGAWDSLMMWSMLDSISDRNMYYNHMNEPAFQSWRSDAQSLCNQGNQEVCTKLKDLDSEVASLKSKGVKQDPTYITEGVDPGVYLSDNVKFDDLGEIKVCTGTVTSDYSRFATQLAASTKLKIKSVYSNGSMDNMKKLAAGECDMAFTQADVLTASSNLEKVFELDKPEQTMLICNNDSGVKTVADLTKDHTIYIGSDQTGSHYTYDELVMKKFGKFGTNIVDDTKPVIAAANLVSENKNACLFTVDTFDAPFVQRIAETKKAHFVSFDNDLVTGYVRSYIDDNALSDKYKTLTQDKYKSWFGFWSKGTPVLSVTPVLVTTDTWAQNNPVALYDVIELNKNFLKQELK